MGEDGGPADPGKGLGFSSEGGEPLESCEHKRARPIWLFARAALAVVQRMDWSVARREAQVRRGQEAVPVVPRKGDHSWS